MKNILDTIFLTQDSWWYRFLWNSLTRGFVLWMIKHLPLRTNRIVLFNRTGGPFDCNPAAIVKEILSNSKYSSLEPWFVVKDLNDNSGFESIPKGCGAIQYTTLQYYYIYYTSKFIVVNVIQRLTLYKRKNQICIQTGHGGHGIKCFYFDNPESVGVNGLAHIKEETGMFNLCLSDSSFFTSIIRSAYGYKGEVLECGFPRNKIFFDCIQRVKTSAEPRYVIYTPTYRFDGRRDVYGFDFDRVINAFEKRFGGTWYVRVSAHPMMREFYHELYDFSHPRLIDVGGQNLQPLLLTSDALITDYSSASMDFSMLDVSNINSKNRFAHPVFQLFKDRDVHDCDFYIEPKDLPFPYAENDDELVNNILSFNEVEYLDLLDIFNKDVIKLKEQGIAAELLIHWLVSHM